MRSIAVTKPNPTAARQELLSPFALLTQLFTQELIRRNGQAIGSYRPMSLAYLEEEEREAQPVAPEIRFDLNIDLLVNRLAEERQDKQGGKKAETPAERIIERILLREKELRTVYRDTRRIVIESGGRQIAATLPAQNEKQNDRTAAERETTQPGEGRSSRKTEPLRRSAELARFSRAAVSEGIGQRAEQMRHRQPLPLASQMTSAPAAGGWTPQQRELHPGYPVRGQQEAGVSPAAGSILLPDVLRRRRETALETQNTQPDAADGTASLEDALIWSAEGVPPSPETDRVLLAVRKAVRETLRRNAQRRAGTTHSAADSEPDRPEQPAEDARPKSQALPEKTDEKQGKETALPFEKLSAGLPAKLPEGTPTALPTETDTKPAVPAELAYRAETGEAPQQSAAQPAATAIPADAATQPSAPAELAYREETGEPPQQSAMKPAATAIPEETATQPPAPAELAYRE